MRLEPESPAPVFAFGGDQVSDVVLELEQACGPIVIRAYEVEAAAWTVDQWRHAGSNFAFGSICAVGGNFCSWNLYWCAEPPPCE